MRAPILLLTAVALCLFVAAPIHAMTVSGVSTIRVTTFANPGVLQIAEIVALDPHGTDLALAATSTTTSSGAAFNSEEASAINGITTGGCEFGCTPADPGPEAGRGMFHAVFGSGEFFEVHLNTPADISALSIFGRIDCCSDRDIYNVTLLAEGGGVLFSAVNQSADNLQHEAVIFSAVPLPPSLLMLLPPLLVLIRRRA